VRGHVEDHLGGTVVFDLIEQGEKTWMLLRQEIGGKMNEVDHWRWRLLEPMSCIDVASCCGVHQCIL
jgi:hypothetical protein